MFSAKIMRRVLACTAIAGALASTAPAFAALTLTGNVPGFSLTTFATGFATAGNDPNGIGVIGVTVDSYQHVYATDYPTGGVYVFPNRTNGQTTSSPGVVNTLPNYGAFNANDMTQVNGGVYMASDGASQLRSLNTDGTVKATLWPGTWIHPQGVTTNIATGHLFVSTGYLDAANPATIEEIDPVQAALNDSLHPGTSQFITSTTSDRPNSMAVSADGSILYAVWSNGFTLGYSTAINPAATGPTDQHLVVWSMNTGNGSIVLGKDGLAGKMFLNKNGEIDEIDMATQTMTVIANGGSYSGYMSADPFDGSLYVTNSDTIFRLTAPGTGKFLSAPPVAIPEPASIALIGVGGLAVLGLRGKRKAK